MTQKAIWAAGAAGVMLASAIAGPAGAAIFIKIPSIPGESKGAAKPGVEPDEIDVRATLTQRRAVAAETKEQQPYLTIKLEKVVVTSNTADARHNLQLGRLATDSDGNESTQAADHNHEGWIDVLSWSQPAATADTAHGARLTGIRSHKPLRAAQAERAEAETREAASGLPTGKRQHKPVVVTKPIDKASPLLVPVSAGAGALHVKAEMPGCEVGARYPHMLVGDDEVGKEVRLEGVTITECASEEFSLNYEKVKF